MSTIERILVAGLFITVLIVSGCIGNSPADNLSSNYITEVEQYTDDSLSEKQNSTSADYVEVIHFHATRQCYSCKMVGSLAEKTVNTYFNDELNSGKLVFAHVNTDLPENKEFVMKYGATGSSLWIGTYVNGTSNKEQDMKVWYKISDEQDYLNYLKGVLEKRLEGDLS
jgi:outer membrane murein-binding lipoprotein Lpp